MIRKHASIPEHLLKQIKERNLLPALIDLTYNGEFSPAFITFLEWNIQEHSLLCANLLRECFDEKDTKIHNLSVEGNYLFYFRGMNKTEHALLLELLCNFYDEWDSSVYDLDGKTVRDIQIFVEEKD